MAAAAADVPLLIDEDDGRLDTPVPEAPDIELNLDELAALSDLSDKKADRPVPVTAPLIPADENLPAPTSSKDDLPVADPTPAAAEKTSQQQRDAIDDLLDDSTDDDYETEVVAPKQSAPVVSDAVQSDIEKLLAAVDGEPDRGDAQAAVSSAPAVAAPAPPKPEPPKPAFRREEILAGAGMVMPEDAPQRMVVSTHKPVSHAWRWVLVAVMVIIFAIVALNFLIDAEIFSLGIDVPTTNLL